MEVVMKRLLIIIMVVLFATPALAWRPGDTRDSGDQSGYYEYQSDNDYYREAEQRREERRREMERQRLEEENERLRYERERERRQYEYNEHRQETDSDYRNYYEY